MDRDTTTWHTATDRGYGRLGMCVITKEPTCFISLSLLLHVRVLQVRVVHVQDVPIAPVAPYFFSVLRRRPAQFPIAASQQAQEEKREGEGDQRHHCYKPQQRATLLLGHPRYNTRHGTVDTGGLRWYVVSQAGTSRLV